jgi:hypothetical protein
MLLDESPRLQTLSCRLMLTVLCRSLAKLQPRSQGHNRDFICRLPPVFSLGQIANHHAHRFGIPFGSQRIDASVPVVMYPINTLGQPRLRTKRQQQPLREPAVCLAQLDSMVRNRI